MILKDLLKNQACEVKGASDISINNIAFHSGDAKPGALFVALNGATTDGRQYISEAVERGATALVIEGEFLGSLEAVTQIRVKNARQSLAHLSCEFFSHPTQNFYLCGITGTNGKTTLTYLLEHLWQGADYQTGRLGTVEIRYGDQTIPASHTTPESTILQNHFHQMSQANTSHVAIEVSSHALKQHRVDGSQFDSCVFTNLTQDHLDYHASMADYFDTKKRLFTELLASSDKNNKQAIVCGDDAYGSQLLQALQNAGVSTISYGLKPTNDLHPQSVDFNLDGIKAQIRYGQDTIEIQTPLLGAFNLLNVMAAMAVGAHSGLELNQVSQSLKNIPPIPGRLEAIAQKSERYVFVDYAHTPDALKNILETLKPLAPQNIITVFGCGGDRDRSKRPLMGYQAGLGSTICIATSDNPRTEDPDQIIADILPGLKQAQCPAFDGQAGYLVEVDRKQAIVKALEMAQPNDIVLVAGKGHEDYQIIGTERQPFSDAQIIREHDK